MTRKRDPYILMMSTQETFSVVSDLSIDSPKPYMNPDSSSAPVIGRSGAINIADRGMLVR